MALRLLTDRALDPRELLDIGAIPRHRHFGRRVQIHIINNLRNGYCQEDCRYCAQRKDTKAAAIPAYADKSDQEILIEARQAWESGAYRYCLVSAGRGPNKRALERYARLIRRIKALYPLQLCLSAGLLHDPQEAAILARAGLDRYNHNLNTSERHYKNICSTHTYQDRLDTLSALNAVGIPLCSGLIAGMGESPEDLVSLALELQKRAVVSIPLNFFLPIPGHGVKESRALGADDCLRILCMLRLLNPRAELRMAAGRELYLGQRQGEALAVANSLFAAGYLNARGSQVEKTIAMIQAAGYQVESKHEEVLKQTPREPDSYEAAASDSEGLKMKAMIQLRPFQRLPENSL